MNLLSWNVQGMGSPETFSALRNLINRFHPQVLFICETKSNWAKMDVIKKRIQFKGIHVVNSMGLSGGLTMLWIEDVNVKIIGSLKYFIDAIINPGMDNSWQFMGYYRDLDPSQRLQSWRLLRRLKDGGTLLWLVGAMNEILYNTEKKGGSPRSASAMLQFQEAIDDIGLWDLCYVGYKYTWSNNRNRIFSQMSEHARSD